MECLCLVPSMQTGIEWVSAPLQHIYGHLCCSHQPDQERVKQAWPWISLGFGEAGGLMFNQMLPSLLSIQVKNSIQPGLSRAEIWPLHSR